MTVKEMVESECLTTINDTGRTGGFRGQTQRVGNAGLRRETWNIGCTHLIVAGRRKRTAVGLRILRMLKVVSRSDKEGHMSVEEAEKWHGT